MALGINLSFCVKRWVTPALWARLVREELGLGLVQLSFDLVDPMWPDDVLDKVAADTRKACADHGITLHSGFAGLAAYTFNLLLHPEPAVRDASERWLTRAYAFCEKAGIRAAGGPVGAIAARPDAVEADAIPEADYADLVARLARLADRAKAHGLTELYIEPTPLRREWPWTPAQARRLMADLGGTAVPWRYCFDWGHAILTPPYTAEEARAEPWLEAVAGDIGAVHIQQSDGRLDRHWDFTEQGIVDPAAVAATLARFGLADRPVFLEVFYPFEETDAVVLDRVRRSVAALTSAFGRD